MRKSPTAAELEILHVLWTRGPSTVREVHDELHADKPTGYTTTLKLLQIMADKDLVRRDEKQRAHIYRARIPREQAQTQLVHNLVDKVFGGSASRLVMHALSSKRASAKELAEIRRTLDEMEGKLK
jgi:BlaI family transcriptional regulator, penicillinase repressor